MGLTTGDFPPVDPAEFMQKPYRERIKMLARHWAEYGFGAPKITARDLHPQAAVLLRARRRAGRHAHVRPRPARPGGLVERADRLPEARALDRAARVPRRRRLVGPAGRALQADDRAAGATTRGRSTIRLPPWPDKVPVHHGRRAHRRRRRALPRRCSASLVALALPGRDSSRRAIGPTGPRAAGGDRPDHRRCWSCSACATRCSSSPPAASSTCPRWSSSPSSRSST